MPQKHGINNYYYYYYLDDGDHNDRDDDDDHDDEWRLFFNLRKSFINKCRKINCLLARLSFSSFAHGDGDDDDEDHNNGHGEHDSNIVGNVEHFQIVIIFFIFL